MKKLYPLALIAVFSLLATLSYSQSIVLINGQATEVVLSGSEIETIVNKNIDQYLEGYSKLPTDKFKYAKLRGTESKEAIKEEELKVDSPIDREKGNQIASATQNSAFALEIEK